MSEEQAADLPGQSIDEGRGRIFPCLQCGADLRFHIGKQSLKCPHCGTEQEITLGPDAVIQEQEFRETLLRQAAQRESGIDVAEEHQEVRCESCGGTVLFDGTLTSTRCPYCGSPIQREKIHRGGFRVPVDAVLPFQIDRQQALGKFSDWVRTRWLAPNDFRRVKETGVFNSVYLPFWTFDTMTFVRYEGKRGDNYQTMIGVGKNRRTVTRIRWWPADGRFQRFFDDVLVNATSGLPTEHVDALTPWPFQDAQPFTQQYLAGFLARTYDIELDQGFELARARIETALRADCCHRIGGDHQRLHNMSARYDAVTYKHLLLPVWMLAYRHRDKSYRVLINAVTGKVSGDRPYSWVKIGLLISLVVALWLALLTVFPR